VPDSVREWGLGIDHFGRRLRRMDKRKMLIVFTAAILVGLWASGNVMAESSLNIPPSTSVSVDLWIKPTGDGTGNLIRNDMGVFIKGGGSPYMANQGIGMYMWQNTVLHVIFAFKKTGLRDLYTTGTPGVKVTPDAWNHVGADFDGDKVAHVWVVNGAGEFYEAFMNLDVSDSIINSTRSLEIGRCGPGSGWIGGSGYLYGAMDEFTMKIGGTSVLHLTMDENTGTMVYDNSGFGNDGRFVASDILPEWTTGYTGSGIYVTAGYIQVAHEAIVAGRIYGTVTLQGRTSNSALATFELRQPGTTTLVVGYNPAVDVSGTIPGVQMILPSTGEYQLPLVPVGTFDLAVKVPGYLRMLQANVRVEDTTFDGVTYEGGTVVNVELKGGDINNSNSVNIQDLNVLKTNYGKSGSQ
jgi:hypothetical protein